MVNELRTAETVLATIGAVLWAILPIPQIGKSFRLKSTEFAFRQSHAIEPHVFGVLGAVSGAQCLYYPSGYSKYGVLGSFVAFLLLFGFIETTSIFSVLYSRAPILLYGHASSVLTILGFLPQYIEIYRRKQVKGISNIFLWIGTMGGIFMLASLLCRDKIDIAAAVVYLSTSALNVGIFALAHIFNPRALKRDAAVSATASSPPAVEAAVEKE